MIAPQSSTPTSAWTREAYQRFFDHLYNMGRPDEIFETAPGRPGPADLHGNRTYRLPRLRKLLLGRPGK